MPLPQSSSVAPAQAATLSLASVIESIDNGDAIIILNRDVLRLNSWLSYHPGGEKAILHLVGRDATDEVNSFHSMETRRSMLRYRIGVLEEQWVNITPPLQKANAEKKILELKTSTNRYKEDTEDHQLLPSIDLNPSTLRCRAEQRSGDNFARSPEDNVHLPMSPLSREPSLSQEEVVASFRNLIARMESEGLYDCKPSAYLRDVLRICVIFLIMLLFLHLRMYLISAVFMGSFWHQLVFIAHDAGHMGVTGDYQLDTLIGMTIGNHLGGLSICWWKHNHNVHHIATNSPSHDPDISHLPFLAISPSFFSSLYSTYFERVMPYTPFAHFMTKYQAWTYYPILCFGRFNLYALSLEFLIKDLGPRTNRWHRYYEISGQLFFWSWFGYYIMFSCISTWSSRILFLLVSHAITMPLHVQFTLSHFAMSAEPRGKKEPWVLQQLRTTMDVDCPEWMDWFHGGLQFQTIHHLFPRMPKHNLRKASERVKLWCKSVGAKYEIYGFVECNGKVVGRLEEVAKLARAMGDCQKVIIEKGDYLRGDWE